MRAATLASTVGLLLLLLATIAASGPVEDSYGGLIPPEVLNGKEQFMQDSSQNVEEQYGKVTEEFEGEFSAILDELDSGEQPSEFFLQVVREQWEEMNSTSTEDIHIREDRHEVCHRAINHGDTIALKFGRDKWLGCSITYCANALCPRVLMDAHDWTNCWGEVFHIYRMRPGPVQVGNAVALYYPREGNWFGCSLSSCGKSTCPGAPTDAYGFSHPDRWFLCWGEVFFIYARGKALGEPITEDDYIMLFYPQSQNWISLWPSHQYAHHNTCPGTARPPGTGTYEGCWGEVLEIFKR